MKDTERSLQKPDPIEKEELFHHAIDADEALKAVSGHEGESIHLDAETERRLLRKIDWNLMPVQLPTRNWRYMKADFLYLANVCRLWPQLS